MIRYLSLALVFICSASFAQNSTYIKGPTLIESVTSTATAGGTTTFTVSSNTNQNFTGSSAQNADLPDATTLKVGRRFNITNASSGSVTVRNNGGSSLQVLTAGQGASFVLTNAGTSNGTWAINVGATTGSGSGDVVGPGSASDNGLVLFDGTTGKIIKQSSGSGAVSVSSGVVTAGVLSLANGGTNKNMTAAAGGVVYTDADSQEVTSAGTSGQFLKSNGSSAPSWDTLTVTSSGATEAIFRALITCSSSSAVVSQSGSWISVANISSNRCALTLSGFSAAPVCTATISSTDTTRIYSIQLGVSSSTAASIGLTYLNSGSATVNQGTNDNFFIQCMGAR